MSGAAIGLQARPKGVVRRFLGTSRVAPVAVALTGLAVFMTAIGILSAASGWRVTPYDPIGMDLTSTLQAPSLAHVMGTDELGRDVFSRIVVGARLSLLVAVTVLAFASVFGMIIGTIAGYFGGVVDEALMRVTDMFLAFPFLILAAAISVTFGGNMVTTTAALAVVFWPWYARIARSRVISLRNQEFVLAAKALGASHFYLMFRTLLPLIWPLMMIQATMDAGFVMLSAAGLSFLGLGAQPPTPEWGSMIYDSLSFQPASWWLASFPGASLALTALGFNLLGDALRDFIDPSFNPGKDTS